MKIYEDLVNLHAVSGFERQVRKYMRKELEKYADEIVQDRLGSIFGIKKGEGPVIMIAGHMDEVGAMVTGIQENGFIKMVPIGSVSPEVMVSNVRSRFPKKSHPRHRYAIPAHEQEAGGKETRFDDLLLDVGADSKEHAEAMGIRIGQQITFVNQYYFTEDGKKVVSKAWDNRFGCGMALEVLRALKEEGIAHPNTVVAGGTVQEEVGLRGATTASNMIKPDLFIAVHVSRRGLPAPKPSPRFRKTRRGFFATLLRSAQHHESASQGIF